uniref:Odorant receptor n=1 Tax=Ceracris kiangsu TaxID=227354 RepID=A0A6M6DII9_CERKI|nr:odorant receptor 17 [Ceracris kiangsu]
MTVRVPWTGSLFSVNARILAVAGICAPPGSRLYLVYTGWMLFTQLSFFAAQVQGLWYFWGDVDKITLDACLMVAEVLGIIKIATFLRRQSDFYRIVNKLDDVVTRQRHSGDAEVRSILEASRKTARALTVCVTLLGCPSPAVWTASPFLMALVGGGGGAAHRSLPAAARYTAFDTQSPWFEALTALQFFSMQYSFFTTVGVDMLVVSIMIHASAQLEVLNVVFCRLGKSLGSSVENSDPGASSSYRANIYSCAGSYGMSRQANSAETTTKKKFYGELRDCIRHHQDVIQLVADVERLLTSMILTQVLGATLIICVTLFQFATNIDNIGTVLRVSVYMSFMIYEVFMYCWYAHNIIDQSCRIAESAYCCGWPGAPASLQRAVMVVICRAQRPLALTAGKFYLVSRATFIQLINASYTYYALLRQMSDH